MRAIALVVVVWAVGGVVQAQPLDEEMKKWAGYWKPQSVIYAGQEQMPDPNSRAAITLVVQDGEYRMYVLSDPKRKLHLRLFTADLRLDQASKTFELTVKDGEKKGQKRHGIYEVADGKLRICYGPSEKPRPTKFEAPPGSEYFLE
ncbi:MAG TPA: TIGR03067 domain-containing protein, partial [Fimbriiglobus sp.]|nr:TIGR03067 domain-containing protein [Fimbriiglobus sp.]